MIVLLPMAILSVAFTFVTLVATCSPHSRQRDLRALLDRLIAAMNALRRR